jgi:hypothetical protein
MKLKVLVMGSLAGLAVAAGGCGTSADPPEFAWALRYGSDGTLVVFAGSAIDTYGADLTKPKVHLPVPSPNGALFSVSDDGRVAALSSSSSGHQVALFDLASGQPTGAIAVGQSASGVSPQGLTLSPTGDLLYVFDGVGGDGASNGMFDTSSGKLLWSAGGFGEVRVPFFSPDESTLYMSGVGAGLQGVDSLTGTVRLDASLADYVQAFGGMADPNTLIGVAISLDPVSYAESSEIDLLSTADGSRTGQVPLPANTDFAGGGAVQLPAFHCAPAFGLCAVGVIQYDPNHTTITAEPVQVWALDGTLVQSIDKFSGDIAISPDGQYVAAIYDGDVRVSRVSDGSLVELIPYHNRMQ